LTISAILLPYLWRVLSAVAVAALLAGVAFRAARSLQWWRCGLYGLATALVALPVAWVFGVWGPAAGLVPVVLFGLTGAAWSLRRRRESPGRVLLSWGLAAIPAVLLVTPLM
jgi:hypothetical protein